MYPMGINTEKKEAEKSENNSTDIVLVAELPSKNNTEAIAHTFSESALLGDEYNISNLTKRKYEYYELTDTKQEEVLSLYINSFLALSNSMSMPLGLTFISRILYTTPFEIRGLTSSIKGQLAGEERTFQEKKLNEFEIISQSVKKVSGPIHDNLRKCMRRTHAEQTTSGGGRQGRGQHRCRRGCSGRVKGEEEREVDFPEYGVYALKIEDLVEIGMISATEGISRLFVFASFLFQAGFRDPSRMNRWVNTKLVKMSISQFGIDLDGFQKLSLKGVKRLSALTRPRSQTFMNMFGAFIDSNKNPGPLRDLAQQVVLMRGSWYGMRPISLTGACANQLNITAKDFLLKIAHEVLLPTMRRMMNIVSKHNESTTEARMVPFSRLINPSFFIEMAQSQNKLYNRLMMKILQHVEPNSTIMTLAGSKVSVSEEAWAENSALAFITSFFERELYKLTVTV